MIGSLLRELRALDVRLRLDGDQLRFSAPPGVLTGELRDRIASQRADLITHLRSGAGEDIFPPLRPSPDAAGPRPLSFQQEWLFLLDAMDPSRISYLTPLGLRLEGELDVAALGSALGALLARHASLRTRIVAGPEGPMQVVDPPGPLALSVEDVEGRSAAAVQAREAETPFDLARDPMLRCRLLRLAPTSHLLLLTLHHIAFDDWSVGVLLGELGALYAVETGLAPAASLPPPPAITYADYAVWQRGWLKGAALERELAFWTRHLAGAPQVLDLPTDRPRPAVLDPKASSQPIELPADLVARLRALCRREGITLFMAVLAGFHQVLARWSGQRDILIGVPVAGRTEAALEQVVGCFINTVVMRLDLPGRLSLRQALARVRDAALAAYAHQDTPFARLVEALAPSREPSQTPLVQVGLDLHNTPPPPDHLGPLEAIPVGGGGRGAKLDLFLTLEDTGTALLGSLDYRSALFEPDTMARMAGHLVTVLSAMADAPETPLERLPLLTAAERHDLLIARNATAAPYPHACLSWLIEDQATRTPDAVAVEAPDATLSYAELNRRADRLAWRLSDLGVGPERRVGLCLERSATMLVALLAVMKTGGAFVPLDPAFPPERIAFMLEDSTARVLIADPSLPPGPLPTDLALLRVDDDDNDAPVCPLPRRATPDNLCYQIYTSGSTGRPKGVLVSHRALVNHACSIAARFSLARDDRVLNFSPAGFDVGLEEILPTLLSGAAVVVLASLPSVDEFVALLASGKVTVANLPTPYWRQIAGELERAKAPLPRNLRLLVIGSDRTLPSDADSWRRLASPGMRLVHAYGVTEAAITSITHSLNYETTVETEELPIGSPISNMQAHVLDERLELVPLGVPGQLALAGDGLATGYQGQPRLTAAHFVPNPFATEPGSRLYRTGDRVRRQAPGGDIVFFGRNDDQMKVRGVRVEPGEIESALMQRAGVRAAAAIYNERDQLLTAFVECGPPSVSEPDLLALLRSRLPSAMVPNAVVTTTSLPRTPSGKIDRRALTALLSAWPTIPSAKAADPPRGRLEVTLTSIWAEVLGVDDISRDDDFFALGGQSLKAITIIARVREALGLSVPLRLLFDAPSVASFASALGAETKIEAYAGARAVEPWRNAVEEDAPLSSSQQIFWNLHAIAPQASALTVQATLQLKGPFDRKNLEASFTEVVNRHAILRSAFGMRGGRVRQWPIPPVEFKLAEDASAFLAPFDLEHGRLLRARPKRLGDADQDIAIEVHHIACDAWSTTILTRELLELYSAFRSGQPSPLPPLALQYADFARKERFAFEHGLFDRDLAYWRQQLANMPRCLPHTDFPRERPPSFKYRSQWRIVPSCLCKSVKAAALSEGATLFMACIAAVAVALRDDPDKPEISIAAMLATRGDRNCEALIGCFLNTLVLRVPLPAGASARDALRIVRSVTLEAIDHQAAPFECVAQAANLRSGPDMSPPIATLVNFEQTLGAPLDGQHHDDDATWRAPADAPDSDIEIVPSLFDFIIDFVERGDELAIRWRCSADLFDLRSIERLQQRFECAIASYKFDRSINATGVEAATGIKPASPRPS